MTEYTFTWPKGPSSVVITGDFDNWQGSMPLVKQTGGDFALTMPLPASDNDKFVFKFIVDGNWVVSDKFEKDTSAGPENNVIFLSKVASESDKSNVASTFIPESALNAKISQKPKVQPAPGSNKKGKKKKVKVKKRIRKDKKTGERTVISEERTELNSEEGEEYSEEVSTTATSKEVTPLPPQTASTDPVEDSETAPVPTVMPSKENQQITLGEPGIAIVSNANEIKEFREVRDVDAEELNKQLNAELKAKEAAAAAEPAPEAEKEPETKQEQEQEQEEKQEPELEKEPETVAESTTEPAVQTEQLEKEVKPEEEPKAVEEPKSTEDVDLAQRTLDPKVGVEPATVEDANVESKVEEVTDKAVAANDKVAETVTEDLKKSTQDAKKAASEAVATTPSKPAKSEKPSRSAKEPAKEAAKTAVKTDRKPAATEEKKKRGFFSKLKKIFN